MLYIVVWQQLRESAKSPYTDVIRHRNIANHRSILMRLPCLTSNKFGFLTILYYLCMKIRARCRRITANSRHNPVRPATDSRQTRDKTTTDLRYTCYPVTNIQLSYNVWSGDRNVWMGETISIWKDEAAG